MSRSGALSHGFKRVWNDPLLFCAELAWRWTFTFAVLILSGYAILLFLNSLPVSNKDLFRLSGILPGLYLDALASIFRGSGPKIVRLAVVLLFGSCVLWLVASSWGRAVTLADLQKRNLDLPHVSRFHLLRVVLGLISLVAYVGALMLAVSLSDRGTWHHLPTFYFVLLVAWLIIAFVRGTIGWWLALAPFVPEGLTLLNTLKEAADLARDRSSQFMWVNFALSGLRFLILVMAWFAAFSAIGLFAPFHEAYTWASLFLVVIAHSLLKNWVNTWELAAYVRVIEWDGTDPNAIRKLPPVRPPLLEPPVIPAM